MPPLRLTEVSSCNGSTPSSSATLLRSLSSRKMPVWNGSLSMKVVETFEKYFCAWFGARKPVCAVPRSESWSTTSRRMATLPLTVDPKSL